jgi:hypothetical protein
MTMALRLKMYPGSTDSFAQLSKAHPVDQWCGNESGHIHFHDVHTSPKELLFSISRYLGPKIRS